MRNTGKKIILAFVLMSLSGGLFAGGTQEIVRERQVKAAALKGPSGFGIIKMLDESPELLEGVSTEFSVLPTPPEMVARVASAELDVALLPSNMAAKLYSEGPGYKLGAVVGMGVLSVLSRDEEIRDWSDLAGRKINSIGKGATPDYLFAYLLQRNGLDPEKDLQRDFSISNAAQLTQALISGKVETAVLPQPFVTMALAKSPDVREVFDLQETWKKVQGSAETYPITVVVFKPSLVEERPDIVEAFLEEYEGSIAWVNANPARAAELIEKHDVLPAAMAEPAIPHCNLRFIPAVEAKGLMEEYLSVLLDFNPAAVGGRLPDEHFYFQSR
ncbi:MAG TPA: ABC transporter substrate-binding protein [Sediminispirochaeta sp.]|nr:ABC transporter substrate-binding protein [Sediminispirochaeta sp.]